MRYLKYHRIRNGALSVELRIGVCDDQIECQKKVTDMLKSYETDQNIQLSIYTFGDEDTLRIFKGKALHVLFMDTELENVSGIYLACEVNRRWPDCQIIYLSESLEHLYDVYCSKHLFFILKDQLDENLNEIMGIVRERIEQISDRITLTLYGNEKICLSLSEIIYFERRERITRVVSMNHEYVVDEKISVLEKELPSKDFIRCHNSYIVYLPAVKKYTNKSFLMCDGSEILISRGYREQTKRAFERWAGIVSDEWGRK